MADLAKYHFQVTALDTSASSIDDNQALTAAGITNTGNVTSTGSVEATGGLIIPDDNDNRVKITATDLGGGSNAITLTRL